MCRACSHYCCASDADEACGCYLCPELSCQPRCEECGELDVLCSCAAVDDDRDPAQEFYDAWAEDVAAQMCENLDTKGAER